MVKGEPVPYYGDGMYVIDNDHHKRAPRRDAVTLHDLKYSRFQRESGFCGVCHDATNPINHVPIQRTYSEWRKSAYAKRGQAGSCQSCHMRSAPGFAADPRLTQAPHRPDVRSHDLTGGSNWVYDALPLLWDGLESQALQEGKRRALETLGRAADLRVSYRKADRLLVAVRVTNKTGHKLPTGFPDGRRMWLNVKGFDLRSRLVFESGRYEAGQADLAPDAQLKVYRAERGIRGSGRSFDPAQSNYFVFDNRIPPKGFRNASFRAVGAPTVGYAYKDGQHWDDTAYALPLSVVRLRVALLYQTSEKAYIEFLVRENKSNTWGRKLASVWEQTGRSAPVQMMVAETQIR